MPPANRTSHYRLAIDVAEVAQSLSRSIDGQGSRAGRDVEDTHYRHLPRLLRGDGQRLPDEATCDAANERSPVHHCIAPKTIGSPVILRLQGGFTGLRPPVPAPNERPL